MKGVDRLYEQVYKGQKGKNIGISMGLPELDKILYGIQREHLYCIGADTAGGKTSFGLDVFVYNAFKNAGERKINILYYSFEMSEESLYAKLLSRYIFDKYQEVISYEEILSLTKPISDEHLEYVIEAKEWLKSIEPYITIYDKPLIPEAIYGTLKEWLKKFGTFIPINEHKEDYAENDDTEYKIVLWDHVSLTPGQGTKKERIDKVVEYLIYFRDKCKITGVMIQQLNRNSKGMDRKLNGYELIQLDDFSDSSGTTQGANVVIALYYPYREKIPKCEGYPIQNILKNQFRLVQILKHRLGRADLNKGVTFHGEIGMFRELPRPEEISDYSKFLDLKIETDDLNALDEQENDNVFKF